MFNRTDYMNRLSLMYQSVFAAMAADIDGDAQATYLPPENVDFLATRAPRGTGNGEAAFLQHAASVDNPPSMEARCARYRSC